MRHPLDNARTFWAFKHYDGTSLDYLGFLPGSMILSHFQGWWSRQEILETLGEPSHALGYTKQTTLSLDWDGRILDCRVRPRKASKTADPSGGFTAYPILDRMALNWLRAVGYAPSPYRASLQLLEKFELPHLALCEAHARFGSLPGRLGASHTASDILHALVTGLTPVQQETLVLLAPDWDGSGPDLVAAVQSFS
jgi:hypothetical protein